MNSYYNLYNLDPKFIKKLKSNVDNVEHTSNMIQNRFLNVIKPSFNFKSYRYINKEPYSLENIEHTHVLVIGLSDYMLYDSSSIVLNLPLDSDDIKQDYNLLLSSTDKSIIWDIFKKYNISCYNTSKILERQAEVVESLQGEYIPTFISNVNNGKSILFKKVDFNFYNGYINTTNNEYLVIYLNEGDNINITNKIKLCNTFNTDIKGIPFQVLKFVGNYNDKSFEYIYTMYWFFDRDIKYSKMNGVYDNKISQLLEEIYEEIKKRNNTKYREFHLDSRMIDYKSETRNELLDLITSIDDDDYDIYFDYKNSEEALHTINNYVANNKFDFGEFFVQHVQTVVNTWEENGHGMLSFRDEIYDETTKLECDVYILFGTYVTSF